MAERKPLFMSSEGFSQEMATTDTLTLGGATINGTLTMGTDNDIVLQGGGEVTGLPNTPSVNSAATSKYYVDNLISGLVWREPCLVLSMVDDASSGPPGSPADGAAYVVDVASGAWSGFSVGDIVEYTTAGGWQLVLAGSGGNPANGARVIVASSPGSGSFTGHALDIAIYSSGWSFVDPLDGWAVLINGENAKWENTAWVYDTSGPEWIQFSGTGAINAGIGLSKDGNTLNVNLGDGITQLPSDYVGIDLASSNPGLTLSGTSPDKKLAALADTTAGIEITANGIAIDLAASNPGLQFSSGDLAVLVDTSYGLSIAASGIQVDLDASDPGLEFNSGDLRVKVDGAHGIIRGTSGLEIEIDDTPDTLDVDADGLKVVGLPSLFKINGTAVSANVTAPNLDTLTGGGSTTLHTHPGVSEAERVENAYTCSEDIAKGDPVYMSGSDTIGKGDCDIDAKSRIIGVAKAAATSGNPCEIISMGEAAGAGSGWTANDSIYLASGGGLTNSVPGAGKRVVLIGYAMTSTDLFIHHMDYGKKA